MLHVNFTFALSFVQDLQVQRVSLPKICILRVFALKRSCAKTLANVECYNLKYVQPGACQLKKKKTEK